MSCQILRLWIYALTVSGVYCNCEQQTIPRACDYVIVGAGASGATIAGRLSETKDITVCLFEAGSKDWDIPLTPTIETPLLWTQLAPGPITWNYTTVPQKGLNKRELFVGMGKALGGSTTHNAMLYFRGTKVDYDYWEASGAKGWSYDDVFPHFLKSENNISPLLENSDLHSKCGPVTISQNLNFVTTPLYKLFINTAKELKIPLVDCAEHSPLGLCLSQWTIKGGKRVTTSDAFLRPVLGRRNLVIITEAYVEKIAISDYGNRAFGIHVSHKGKTFLVKTKREVIVSAGTFESPKLLQSSGIGPKSLLKKFNIRPYAYLPVGKSFHNQLIFLLDLLIDVPTVTPEVLNDPRTLSDYVFHRKGLYAESTGTFTMFTNTEEKLPFNWPTLQSLFMESLIPSGGGEQKRNGTTIINFLLHPKSRGTVQIRSRDPNDLPLIDPRSLTDDFDIQTFIAGIRKLQPLIKALAMKAVNAELVPFGGIPESCRTFVSDSDEQWECLIRTQATMSQHPVGTCKMGDRRDKRVVVDPKLRVLGIRNLRVADASVMPETTSCNTMGPSIMIGEKATSIIIKEHFRTQYNGGINND